MRADPRATFVGRYLEILHLLGAPIPSGARVLDLGCGAGGTVYQFLDAGYDAVGFDVKDYLKLRQAKDRERFRIGLLAGNRLPFSDNEFDLIISEQVVEHVKDQKAFFDEVLRVIKPGAVSLHTFPAYYSPIEPHIYVPFGHLCVNYYYYLFWAALGVRNEFQKGLSAPETARRNCIYAVEGLYYVSNSVYAAFWDVCGFEVRWFENENLRAGPRSLNRLLGHIDRFVPAMSLILRNFLMRRVCLKKPSSSVPTENVS
jgi:SAM-dependent methyltransferase